MKRALMLLVVGLPVIPFAGCSSEAPPEVEVGGTSSTGGAPGTAGSTAGTAPGASGSASGSSSTAGSSSTGGSGGGSGGSVGASGSGMGGSGGSTGGSGGTGTAGTAGSGTAGMAGTAGTGGGGSAVSVGKLDGFFVSTPCGEESGSTDDCSSGGWIYEGKNHACAGGKLDTDFDDTKALMDFPVTGEAGKIYTATMHFYGVMEPKNYGNNVTRESGTTRPGNGNPSMPAPFATGPAGVSYASSNYNTYEIHVINDKGAEVKVYFINSDTSEGHYTYAIDYERPIEIVGGGKVHVRIRDDNCRQIKNCGTGGAPCDAKARTITGVSAAMPAVTVAQPGLGKATNSSGQWFVIDVKTIVPKG
jgi:hypothetical protein